MTRLMSEEQGSQLHVERESSLNVISEKIKSDVKNV